jgi:hypothetical protein
MTSNATSTSIAILLFSLTLARADFSCAAYTLPSSYYRQPGLNCTLASDLDARCLTLEVPLEPTAPARGNISLFVKNVRARRQPAIGGTVCVLLGAAPFDIRLQLELLTSHNGLW